MNFGLQIWWGRNKISFTAMAMVVAPSLFVSTTVPDAFSAATDIAVSRNYKTNKEFDAQFKFYLLTDCT